MDGWIKLHRKTRQSRVYKDPLTYLIWTECLLSAASTRHWVSVRTGRGETQVELLPGQFVFGRHAWERRLGIANWKIYARIKKLEKWGNLGLKRHTHFSVVTICHWATYQGGESGEGQPTKQPTHNQHTTNTQPTHTYKKEEKGKKVKKKSADVPIPTDLDTQDFRNAWGEWLTYRRGRRLTCTEQTLAKQLALLAGWGVSKAIRSINASITAGWAGLFDKEGKHGTSSRSSRF